MEIKKNYFLFSAKNSASVPCAIAPEGTRLAHELISDLSGKNTIPFKMNLIKISKTKKGIIDSLDFSNIEEIWIDYLPNSLAFPLMSEKLKLLINENLTGNENIDWIECPISYNNFTMNYNILRFNVPLDVIDIDKSIYVKGTSHIIKPVFSFEKIKDLSCFPAPLYDDLWKITPSIYMSEELIRKIKKGNITGVVFDKAIVS